MKDKITRDNRNKSPQTRSMVADYLMLPIKPISLLAGTLALVGSLQAGSLDTPWYPKAPTNSPVVTVMPNPPMPVLALRKSAQMVAATISRRYLTNSVGVLYAIVALNGRTNYLTGNYIPDQFDYISCAYGIVSYWNDGPGSGAHWFFTTNSLTGQPLYFYPQEQGYTYIYVNPPPGCYGPTWAHGSMTGGPTFQ